METREIIEKINGIMGDYEDNAHFRPLPYLGLVWRDIELDETTIRFSKPVISNFYYLDMAWKWDYPMIELTLEEAHPILEKMLMALKAMIELTTSLKISTPTTKEMKNR